MNVKRRNGIGAAMNLKVPGIDADSLNVIRYRGFHAALTHVTHIKVNATLTNGWMCSTYGHGQSDNGGKRNQFDLFLKHDSVLQGAAESGPSCLLVQHFHFNGATGSFSRVNHLLEFGARLLIDDHNGHGEAEETGTRRVSHLKRLFYRSKSL